MAIQTPDQHLRVFVSSTLEELADERRAVARAIKTLRLTPVMFESGARPYPPRDLYRAYLAQSDIFIGIYWQRYGWIGPGMEISGLEDEFDLSRELPRLLYVKAPAPDREPRLTEFLSRIQDEALGSYRTFRTPGELGRLVCNDLATLLSERFADTRPASASRVATASQSASASSRRPPPLPVAVTSMFGREKDIDELARLLTRSDVRLVSLTGPGGIGKTRLAVAVSERLRDAFGSGIVFVELEEVSNAESALASIGREVGADLMGAAAPMEALVEQLDDGRRLLILDNLEQVVAIAPDLDQLLARCPGVTILATSLKVLQLRAEREYPVPPLPVPADPAAAPLEELASSPAVALFLDRARAVRYDFALTEENAPAVLEICQRLEGMPLAIELAAARIRLLDPDALLRRLATSLDALGTGTVDMPERHRTLRATFDWSVGILDPAERSLLEILAVFVDGWTIEAAAHVADLDEDRVLELSEALARNSLILLDQTEFGPRSRILKVIREFLAERLEARSDFTEIERRHAEYFRAVAEHADRPLRRVSQSEYLKRLEIEASNLAAAVRWYMVHDSATLPHLLRILYPFWSLQDHMATVSSWINQLLPQSDTFDLQARAELMWMASVTAVEVSDNAAALAASERLAALVEQIHEPFFHALCQLVMAWNLSLVGDFDGAILGELAALDQLRGQDEPFWTAIAAFTAGTMETVVGRDDDALGHLHEAHDLAERFNNSWVASGTKVQLAILEIARGQLDEAQALLDKALALSISSRSTQYLTQTLAAFGRLAFERGEAERAALLIGAADGLRRRVGLRLWPMLRRGEAEVVAQVRQALTADRSEELFARGSRLNRREAVAAISN
jgi:predicted ATPase